MEEDPVRRMGIFAAAAALALGLSGCDPVGTVDGEAGGWQAKEVELPSGDKVSCLLYVSEQGSAISCDWPERDWTPIVEEEQ
jgi:hypothetical protein